MTFKEKIDIILKIKKLKIYKLAEKTGLGGTLHKAYQFNRPMREKTTDILISKMHINREWWESGKGDVFTNEPDIDDNDQLPLIKDLTYKLHEQENNNKVHLKTIEDYGNLVSRLNSEIANLKLTINKYEDRFGIDLS